MATQYIIVFSAIFVLTQGSTILSIERESEVALHSGVASSGAPVVVVPQGNPSVYQPQRPTYSHGPGSIPVGGTHRVIGSGLASPHPSSSVSFNRPATVVVPAPRVVISAPRVVAAPVVPIRHPHGVAAPVAIGSGHGNIHQTHHLGHKPY
ncbi:uncharacterized protein LOC6537468 [Drosophila yakuba]|uniref:Uncharacterized protein n=1 Tax=Drosophila yakuba TaxID=7245 RepID=B4PUS9_DROYA|nr:uncharacterized protein LOC6537468 [Drosophila yakuba]EDW97736.1 uncharacterized protein Dyak_GE10134 [Drosophila yakuba]